MVTDTPETPIALSSQPPVMDLIPQWWKRSIKGKISPGSILLLNERLKGSIPQCKRPGPVMVVI